MPEPIWCAECQLRNGPPHNRVVAGCTIAPGRQHVPALASPFRATYASEKQKQRHFGSLAVCFPQPFLLVQINEIVDDPA